MKILTDSAADLTAEETEEYGITVAPLYIQFPEGEMSSMELTPDEFYYRLEAMAPRIPSTAQPSPGIFAEIYQKLAELGEEILSIHVSSGLSGTLQSAILGARNLPKEVITHIDSMTLSGGQRFQVLAAAMASKAGWAKETILERLREIRQSTEVIYTLETLEYLAHGGRIGRVQALAGSLLKLKPVIRVEHTDGKYSSVGKARTMRNTLGMIVDHLAGIYGTDTPVWVSVMHGKLSQQADVLAELLRERINVARIEVLRISPVLGVHTGPGIVGATVVPMRLMEDLV